MLRNFFVLMFRNFFRQKFYSVVNIAGLAAGITVSIFILLFVVDELSFDTMHSKADRIYRVVEKRVSADKESKIGMTAGILAYSINIGMWIFINSCFSVDGNNLYLCRLSVNKSILYKSF